MPFFNLVPRVVSRRKCIFVKSRRKEKKGKALGTRLCMLFLSGCELYSRWVPLSCQSYEPTDKTNNKLTDQNSKVGLTISEKRRIGSNSPLDEQ